MEDHPSPQNDEQKARRFEQEAAEPQRGLLMEFLEFLRYNKKWWLAPIVLVLLAIGLLVLLSGTGAAPWIYTIF